MAKAKPLPANIKIKIMFDVDRALYDRIVAQAKKENLKGSVENVLTQNCVNWFKQWVGIFAAMDKAGEAAKGPGLVGLDGEPLARPGGNGDGQ